MVGEAASKWRCLRGVAIQIYRFTYGSDKPKSDYETLIEPWIRGLCMRSLDLFGFKVSAVEG